MFNKSMGIYTPIKIKIKTKFKKPPNGLPWWRSG